MAQQNQALIPHHHVYTWLKGYLYWLYFLNPVFGSNATQRPKLADLYDYLNRNQAYLINYQERAQQYKTYTSQVAESHIESIINARHKKSGKMQWTREGAHKVLQIRGVIASNEWGNRWQSPVLSALGVTA